MNTDNTRSQPAKRIFISYGRADAMPLAERLEDDLKRRGYDVWLDRKGIASGKSWEEQIERAILEHEVFVALLSPHAVRRPDGVCLDEISMARYNERKIIPAMVIECRPPLGIYRLDWVDFQQWEQPARYDQALQRLIDAATAPRDQGVEGTHARIFSSLRPLDFGIEIGRLTKDFTGRRWLVDALDRWLKEESSRVFFITGDPGTGKSAVMAHLQHKHPDVGACHFCLASYGDSLDPFRFVRSLAAQLATQLPLYREALDVALDGTPPADPGSLLRRLIAEPLRSESPDKPVLLVIDAMDEAFLIPGTSNIATVLCNGLNDLPSWVRLIISSRKEPEIIDLFSSHRPVEIDAARAENLADISEYLATVLAEPDLAASLAKAGVSAEQVAQTIAAKGAGVFLYVTQAVEAIRRGQFDPSRPDSFPEGLVGMYKTFFERVFPQGAGFAAFRPSLDVICAAREPISADQIAACLGSESWDIEQGLERVAAFFPHREHCYRPFHKSVTDWLSGVAGQSRRFRINLKSGHQKMAAHLLEDYRRGKIDPFLLKHLPAHLIGAEQWDDLGALLSDLEFLEAKVRAGMINELQQDYQQALMTLPEAKEEIRKEQERQARLEQYARDRIAFARGEIAHLEPVAAVPIRTDEQIADDSRRTAQQPTRLDLVRVFGQFVQSEAHLFHKGGAFPRFVVQQAFNHARSGPVAEAAEMILRDEHEAPVFMKALLSRPEFNSHPACLMVLEGHTDEVYSFALSADGKHAVAANSGGTLRVLDLATGACLKVLEGHTSEVVSVALSDDGKQAVSASYDGKLRVWDLATGACLKVLEGHEDSAESMALSADGKRAVVASWDGTLRVWDLTTGACLKILEGHEDSAESVALSADGKRAVAASWDGTLRVWDLATGACLTVLKGHTDCFESVILSADGKRAFSASEDGTLRLWDLATGACLKVLEGHTRKVVSVALSADGKQAVSASWDDTLCVWDLATGACLKVLEGHTSGVVSVALSADGKRAVSASDDKALRVWDLATGDCLKVLEGHTSEVVSVALSADGKQAVSASNDGTLRVWDLAMGACLKALDGHAASVSSIALGAGGQQAVSASGDGTLRVWDLATGACLKVLEGHTSKVVSVALSADGKQAVSASIDGTLRVWDLAMGACLKALDGRAIPVFSVALSADGQWAVSASDDGTLRIWDLATGTCLKILEGNAASVNSVALSAAGKHAVAANWGGALRVLDLATGACLTVLKGHTECVDSVALSADGKRAVSCDDKALRVWDLATGACLKVLEGHTSKVVSVALSTDGKQAVSASDDGTLRVWDLATGACLKVLEGHAASVNSIALSVGGQQAVPASCDGTLRVWDLAMGACLKALKGHANPVFSVALSADGKQAVSASIDGTLRVWDLAMGACLKVLEGHERPVVFIALSADGKQVASASDDGTLRVWDLATGACLKVLEGHERPVVSVALSADGKQAVVARWDGTLRVWDLTTGACLKALKGHTAYVNSVALSTDGKWAVSASDDGTLRVWDLATGACLKVLKGHTDRVNSVALSADGMHAVSASDDNTWRLWSIDSGTCLLVAGDNGPGHAILSCAAANIVYSVGKQVVTGEIRNTF